MGDLEFFLLIVVAALFIAIVTYVFLKLKGYMKSSQPDSGRLQQLKKNIPRPKRPGETTKPMQAMYRPKEVGHRTDKKRLFLTNKGLKSFYVNEFNMPMPRAKPH